MNKEIKKQTLREAQDKIYEAINLIKEVDDSERTNRYLIAVLEQAIGGNNEWLGGGNQANIENLIEDLKN